MSKEAHKTWQDKIDLLVAHKYNGHLLSCPLDNDVLWRRGTIYSHQETLVLVTMNLKLHLRGLP